MKWKPEFFNLLKLPKDSKSRGFYLYNELISKKPDYISERVIDQLKKIRKIENSKNPKS